MRGQAFYRVCVLGFLAFAPFGCGESNRGVVGQAKESPEILEGQKRGEEALKQNPRPPAANR